MTTKIILFFMVLLSISIVSCRYKRIEVKVPHIAEKDDVYIDSQPTEAMIYINNEKIGKTPLVTKVWFTEKKELKITALPLYEDQYRQDLVITIPAIPRKLTFFMTNKPEETYKLSEVESKPDIAILTNNDEETVPVVLNTYFSAPVIYFALNNIEIDETSTKELLDFIDKIKENPIVVKINLHGYADESGNKDINKNLSLNRAAAVKEFLVNGGIAEEIIENFGHGEIYTLSKEGIKLEASVNRKVEIRVKINETGQQKPENPGN